MPSRPSRPSSGATSFGKWPFSNQSSMPGRTRSWTYLRTVSRIIRSSSPGRWSISRKSRGLISVRAGASLAIRLLTFEFRFLLAQEAHDPDHSINAKRRFGKVAGLDLEALGERAVQPAVDGVLGEAERAGGRLGQPAGQLGDGGVQIVRRHRPADQPDRLRFGGAEAGPLEDHRQCPGLADQARQPLRPAGSGDDPERRLRLADLGAPVLDHHPVVAAEGQLAAAAQGMAVDAGDNRLGAGLDVVEALLQ